MMFKWSLRTVTHRWVFKQQPEDGAFFYCYEIVLNIEQVTLTESHSGASSHCSTVVTELYGYEEIWGKEFVTLIRS